MATTQIKILTRAQRIARRRGIKQPEVDYRDDQGHPIVVIDPATDEFVEKEKGESN